jgi:RNA polymerase sigma-70 factor (ECF subfamily)
LESRTILQRVAAGDPGAVSECLDRYGGIVSALARRMSSDVADAEDAVQEIFVDVWRNAPRFDPAVAGEATFLAMLARRRLIDRGRRRARHPAAAPLEAEPAAVPTGPADPAEIGEEAARARVLMGRLRPTEREVLDLAIDRGLSQTEIASALNLPVGTVKSLARRGLQRLRDMMTGAACGQKGGDR